MSEEEINIIVNGNKISSGCSIPRTSRKCAAYEEWKIFSGEVNAPKNGTTKPILIISTSETMIIKNINERSWYRRRILIWDQSRRKTFK